MDRLWTAQICSGQGAIRGFAQNKIIHVIRLHGGEAETHSFPFPADHFAKVPGSPLGQCDKSKLVCLMIDFLGKSNIMLGNLKISLLHTSVLFSLDLDAAVTARTEEQRNNAFSLPLNCNSVMLPDSQRESILRHNYEDWYQPVYKTDRINGSVEVVGVSRKKLESDAAVVETHMFVTEMKCSEI